MIFLLATDPVGLTEARRHLRNVRPRIDSSFRGWDATGWDDRAWRVLEVAAQRDALYAAARLAERREAKAVVVLGSAVAEPTWWNESINAPTAVLEPTHVHEGGALESLQRLTPDLATEDLVKLPADFAPREHRLARAGEAPRLDCMRMALPLTVPTLARAIASRFGAVLFDEDSTGAAQACEESELSLFLFKRCRPMALPRWRPMRSAQDDLLERRAWNEFFAQSPLFSLSGT